MPNTDMPSTGGYARQPISTQGILGASIAGAGKSAGAERISSPNSIENINERLGNLYSILQDAIARTGTIADRLYGASPAEATKSPEVDNFGGIPEVNQRITALSYSLEELHSQISRLSQL